jgi:hypothetical protein
MSSLRNCSCMLTFTRINNYSSCDLSRGVLVVSSDANGLCRHAEEREQVVASSFSCHVWSHSGFRVGRIPESLSSTDVWLWVRIVNRRD